MSDCVGFAADLVKKVEATDSLAYLIGYGTFFAGGDGEGVCAGTADLCADLSAECLQQEGTFTGWEIFRA